MTSSILSSAIDAYQYQGNIISLQFSRNSEANVSDFLSLLGSMYISDVCSKFKSLVTFI